MKEISELIIDSDLESVVGEIIDRNHGINFVTRVCESEFLIEDAMFAIEKAHISSEGLKCIILAAPKFSAISQNKLLKVIEEPPKNIIFKLITANKTTILPTILSRLPVINHHAQKQKFECNIKHFGLEYIYNLIQENKGIKPDEVQFIVESIAKEAFKSQDFDFKQNDYDSLQNCIRLLDLGSPAVFILNSALLILLEVKTRTLHANKKS